MIELMFHSSFSRIGVLYMCRIYNTRGADMDKPERIKAGQDKVRQLVRAGDYDGAIRVLKVLDHPKVPDWIAMVERKRAESEFENALASAPVSMTQTFNAATLPASEVAPIKPRSRWRFVVYVVLMFVLLFALDAFVRYEQTGWLAVAVLIGAFLVVQWLRSASARAEKAKVQAEVQPVKKEENSCLQALGGFAVIVIIAWALVTFVKPSPPTPIKPFNQSVYTNILAENVSSGFSSASLDKIGAVLDANGRVTVVLTYLSGSSEVAGMVDEWITVFRSISSTARSNGLKIDRVTLIMGDALGNALATVDADMSDVVALYDGKISRAEFVQRIQVETF